MNPDNHGPWSNSLLRHNALLSLTVVVLGALLVAGQAMAQMKIGLFEDPMNSVLSEQDKPYVQSLRKELIEGFDSRDYPYIKPAEENAMGGRVKTIDQLDLDFAVAAKFPVAKGDVVRLVVYERTRSASNRMPLTRRHSYSIPLEGRHLADDLKRLRSALKWRFFHGLAARLKPSGHETLFANCVWPDQRYKGLTAEISRNITLEYPALLLTSSLSTKYSINGVNVQNFGLICSDFSRDDPIDGYHNVITGYLLKQSNKTSLELYWRKNTGGHYPSIKLDISGMNVSQLCSKIVELLSEAAPGG